MKESLSQVLPSSVTSGALPDTLEGFALFGAWGFLLFLFGFLIGRLIYLRESWPVRAIRGENRKERERVDLYRATIERQESAGWL